MFSKNLQKVAVVKKNLFVSDLAEFLYFFNLLNKFCKKTTESKMQWLKNLQN